MSNLKTQTLEFIKYLKSTEEYKKCLEEFKEFLSCPKYEFDRFYSIIFDVEDMKFEYGEIYNLADGADSIIVLCNGWCWKGEVKIEEKNYEL